MVSQLTWTHSGHFGESGKLLVAQIIPRYGKMSGWAWGVRTQKILGKLGIRWQPLDTAADLAPYAHDLRYYQADDDPASGMTVSKADRLLVREVSQYFGRQEPGPYGQAYRFALQGLFSAKVFVQEMILGKQSN